MAARLVENPPVSQPLGANRNEPTSVDNSKPVGWWSTYCAVRYHHKRKPRRSCLGAVHNATAMLMTSVLSLALVFLPVSVPYDLRRVTS